VITATRGPLYSRTDQRRALAVREQRLVGIVQRALIEIRGLLTSGDLRIAAAMNRAPHLQPKLLQVWHGYVEQLVQALLAPVRLTRAEPDPIGGPAARSAEELARQQLGRLIAELSPTQLAAVQVQIAKLLEFGPSPEVLGAIGQATGLTALQTRQVANAYAAALAQGMSPGRAMLTAQGIADQLLAQRAQTIARQEAVTYTNQLVLQRGRAVDAGTGVITKQWVSARDGRVDGGLLFGVCRQLDDNTRIPIDAPFTFAGFEYDAPPAHIGCRCILEIWRSEG